MTTDETRNPTMPGAQATAPLAMIAMTREAIEHTRRAILAAHAAAVRTVNARSRRAQLKNARQLYGELVTALEKLPSAT